MSSMNRPVSREKVITESRDKTKNPVIKILNSQGEEQKQYNLPVGAHIVVKEEAAIKAGEILIKIPRAVGKAGRYHGRSSSCHRVV